MAGTAPWEVQVTIIEILLDGSQKSLLVHVENPIQRPPRPPRGYATEVPPEPTSEPPLAPPCSPRRPAPPGAPRASVFSRIPPGTRPKHPRIAPPSPRPHPFAFGPSGAAPGCPSAAPPHHGHRGHDPDHSDRRTPDNQQATAQTPAPAPTPARPGSANGYRRRKKKPTRCSNCKKRFHAAWQCPDPRRRAFAHAAKEGAADLLKENQ
ncbi:hypothetical protein FOCC_FOCC015079 [Frankliniella occidentalis]|nr:hypothetical protein FOCC_FOCC015079 [Frankliniella occidentalis]